MGGALREDAPEEEPAGRLKLTPAGRQWHNEYVRRKLYPNLRSVSTSAEARELADKRRAHPGRTCLECGHQFTAYGRQVYCTVPCREAHFRWHRRTGAELSARRFEHGRRNESVVQPVLTG